MRNRGGYRAVWVWGPRARPSLAIGVEQLEGRQLLAAHAFWAKNVEVVARPQVSSGSLNQDIQKLVSDLESIHSGSGVTSSEIAAVASDFEAIAAGATKPSSSSVDTLVNEYEIIGTQGMPITPAEEIVLMKDVDAVLASAHVPESLVDQTVSDVEAVLVSSGTTTADVLLIADDLKAIFVDLDQLRS